MKNWLLFFILVVLSLLVSYLIDSLFVNRHLYFQTFGEQLTTYRINNLIELTSRFKFLGYLLIPVIIFFRVFYTSLFLYMGVFFIDLKTRFEKLFKIAMQADFIFILSAITKLVLLIFYKEINTLEDLQFQPLSIMNFLAEKDPDPLFLYPLNLLNIFELGYFFILAFLLARVVNLSGLQHHFSFAKSFKVVAASYGSGLLIWIVFVLFITINIS